jgi:hypothetical protein
MSADIQNTISSLSGAVRESIKSYAKDLHVALPGIIKSFDASTQLATVQPCIKRALEKAGEIVLPLITNVPVIFPRAGSFVLTMPVKAGDECQILFNERDIGQWVKNGGLVNPSDYRLHSLSDAVAIIGLSSQPNRISNFNASAAELRSLDDSNKISIAEDGTILIKNTKGSITINSNGDIALENGGASLMLSQVGGLSITNKTTGVEMINALTSFAQEVSNTTITVTHGDSAGTYPVDNKAALQGYVDIFSSIGG